MHSERMKTSWSSSDGLYESGGGGDSTLLFAQSSSFGTSSQLLAQGTSRIENVSEMSLKSMQPA